MLSTSTPGTSDAARTQVGTMYTDANSPKPRKEASRIGWSYRMGESLSCLIRSIVLQSVSSVVP